MNPLEAKFLPIYKAAAQTANSTSSTPMPAWYPGVAAAEAWCETGGFGSFPEMPRLKDGSPSYNCLGIKAGPSYTGCTVTADGTEESGDGTFTAPSPMDWRVYPSFVECFADQIRILHTVPRYAPAIAATTPEEYIATEPWEWSTNRQKSADVLATWKAHQDLLGPLSDSIRS